MARHRPAILRGRIPCGQEDFLAWHFPGGERRDTAREIWRLPESALDLDLRGLHPDDDLAALLADRGGDSLSDVEPAMALEATIDTTGADVRTFRQMVDHLARHSERWR